MALTKSDKIFIENALDKQELKFEDKITKFKDEFYSKIDPILKEVVASREDRLIGTKQHIRNETRIEKLEKIHPHNTRLQAI